MQLTDVNLLIYAHNADFDEHKRYRDWLTTWMEDSESFGMSEQVLSSLMRVISHPRILEDPYSADEALACANSIANHPNCQLLRPGPAHWGIFTDLCRQTGAEGNDVPDAYFAALAIEHDCEWLTADTGFKKYPGLRWRHPLES